MAKYKKDTPNIQLIADIVGVSKATVSYVLNRKKGVSPETVKLVEDAIKQHNYHQIYKTRRKKQNNIIGIIVPHNSESFFRRIIEGITAKLNEYNKTHGINFEVIICFSGEKHSEEVRHANFLKSLNIAGLIIAPTYYNQDYLINIFGVGFPIVFIDRTPEIFSGEKIVIKSKNNFEITQECINYLIDLGHRKIGFLYGYGKISTAIERRTAYEQTLKSNNIFFDESLICEIDTLNKLNIIDRVKGGYDAIRNMVEKNKITALFCAHNFGTLSAIKYIVDNSKKIPNDLSVISFDDNEWSESLDISAIRQSTEDIGHFAAQELVKRIMPFLEITHDDNISIDTSAVFLKRKSVMPIEYPLLVNSSDGYVRDKKGTIYGMWN